MQSRWGKAFVLVSSTVGVFIACSNAANNGFSEADAGAPDANGNIGIDAPVSTGVDTGTPTPVDSGNQGSNDDSGNSSGSEAGVCVPDAPSGKCGVAPQCGCQTTETCDVTDNAGDVACIAAGTAAQGQSCTTTAGCARGLTCVDNACRPYCPAGTASGAACTGIAGTNTCFYVPDTNNVPVPNFHICQLNCDLAVGTCGPDDGVEKNVGCVVTDAAGDTDCVPLGTGVNGASCPDASGCKPGFLCVSTSADAAAPGTCRQWCKVSGGTCATGSCNELNPKVVVNGIEYGECE